jgi:tetratricopeptide (TPR) repeat protein
LAKDQIGDAASELEKAIARSPWNLAAQRFLMDCHKKSGDEGGVRRALVAIGMFDPGDAAAAALKEGGAAPASVPSAPARGEVSVGEALIEEAGDAVPTESLAELYVSQGHLEKALDVYRTLAEEDPENTDYLEKISDLQDQLGAGGGAAPETEPADLSEAAEAAPGEADITGDMAAMEEPAPESAPAPALSKAEEMMSRIIDMYINEGNAPLALGLCRKALTAERDSAWLEAKIQELEARLAESGEGDLPRPAEEVIEDAEPSYSGPHSDVVKSLEGWLRTIQRRKARM